MGFVAILGIVSLIGMVIRNSVILIDQIDTEIAAGQHPWNAVIVATEHRLRPILLTAGAAILGMIPIAPTVFWGPMAYAVMGGLVVATLLTLVFLPALYVAWFRIKPISESGTEESCRYLNPSSQLTLEKQPTATRRPLVIGQTSPSASLA
jgi:Cu/Ag efflux pump CusA